MNFAKKLLPLVLLFSSQLLHAEPLVAVGRSGFPGMTQPLILVSEDSGKQWKSTISSSMKQLGSTILSAACHDNECIAIGNNEHTAFPLIYTSSNTKKSWQANENIAGLPENLSHVDLSDLSCVSNSCVVVGRYGDHSPDGSYKPMILRSEDTGKTWTFIKDIPSLYPQGYFFQNLTVNCSGTNCAIAATAAKGDLDSSTYIPFILTSHDSGNSWSFVDKINNLNENHQNLLANITCNGSNCVAAGMEIDSKISDAKPLFIYSNDNGKTWSHSSKIDGLPQANNDINITTLNCSSELCVAGGANMRSDSDINTPQLFVSRDSGKSWTQASLPIGERKHGTINSIQCEGSSCIVLGGYPAFILTSEDAGGSWQMVEKISDQPSLLDVSSLNTLSCKEKECVIAGTRWDNGMYPAFFLLSHDHGLTWEYNQNIIGLPQNEFSFFLTNLAGAKGEFPYHAFGPFPQAKKKLISH